MKNKLVALLTLSSLLFLFFSGCIEDPNYSLDVEGGLVLKEQNSDIFIRAFSPHIEIEIRGFTGNIHLSNCNPGSEIKGVNSEPQIHNNSITLKIEDDDIRTMSLEPPKKTDFDFTIIGDTQGMNHIFQSAVDDMDNIGFLIHLGDMTPSGGEDEYRGFQRVMNSAPFPIYTTIGNHDIKFDGRQYYEKNIAPPQYSFTYDNLNFIFLDTSELSIAQEQLDWMDSKLSQDHKNIIVTHAPYLDPFSDSHTIDKNSKNMVEKFINENDVYAYISGHIHSYYQDVSEGTIRLITGGGGGSLVEGEHHYVMSTKDLNFSKIPIDIEEPNIYEIRVVKGEQEETYTYESLLYDIDAEGYSSFQNQFGNRRGQGFYEGVKIRTLIQSVGGMGENDTLVVESIDGYEQKFGYLNLYPDDVYMEKQGELILALRYENLTIDEWDDGPRLVPLPEDGYYSNEDCQQTSYPGHGYNVYDSAGARWVKYVKSIKVMVDGN
ncbi:MAG: metallophosphoesterase [Thermoplasmata archaeon]